MRNSSKASYHITMVCANSDRSNIVDTRPVTCIRIGDLRANIESNVIRLNAIESELCLGDMRFEVERCCYHSVDRLLKIYVVGKTVDNVHMRCELCYIVTTRGPNLITVCYYDMEGRLHSPPYSNALYYDYGFGYYRECMYDHGQFVSEKGNDDIGGTYTITGDGNKVYDVPLPFTLLHL